MKRLLFTLLLVVLSSNIFAQDEFFFSNPPDYELIGSLIKSKTSNFYYPKLVERFIDADTSLTKDELRCLYYGKVYQDDYAPNKLSLTMEYNEARNKRNLNLMYKAAQKQLEFDPVNLLYNLNMSFVCSKLFKKNSDECTKAARRVTMLTDAILSTGTGRSINDAIYVLRVDDEYAILYVLDLERCGHSTILKDDLFYDKMELRKNRLNFKEIYFDITASFAASNQSFY